MPHKLTSVTLPLIALMILIPIAGGGAVDSPVVWFKKVGAEHVGFSLDGSRLIAWRPNELAVLDLNGDILIELPFRYLEGHACLNFNGDLAAVCFSEIFEVEGYEKSVVYVAVYSVDDGRLLWDASKKGLYRTRVLFIPKEDKIVTLYAGRLSNSSMHLAVECFDALNGSMLWKFTVEFQGVGAEPSLACSEKFIALAVGSKLICLNSNGELLWSKRLPSDVRGLKLALHGNVLAAAEWSRLYVFNASTGRELWCRDLEVKVFSLDVNDNGSLIVVGGWRGVLAFNQYGELIWRYHHGLGSVTPVAVSSEGYTIMAVNNFTGVKAVFISSKGNVLWEKTLSGLSVCTDLAIAPNGEYAALGSEYSGLYLVKGKGYMEAAHPPPSKPPIAIKFSEKPPLRWCASLIDRVKRLKMREDGSLLIATEGWLHLVSSDGEIRWSKMLSPRLLDARGKLIAIAKESLAVLLNTSGVELLSISADGIIESLAITRNSIAIAAYTYDGGGKRWAISFYDLKSGELLSKQVFKLAEEKPSKESGVFIYVPSPRPILKADKAGERLAAALGGRLILMDCRGSVLWNCSLFHEVVMSLDFTVNGVAVGLSNGSLVLLNLKDGAVKRAVNLEAPVINVDASESEYIAAATKDGATYLIYNGRIARKVGGEAQKPYELYYDVAISSDGRHVALAGTHLAVLSSDGKVVFKKPTEEGKEITIEQWLAASSDLTQITTLTSMKTLNYYTFKSENSVEETDQTLWQRHLLATPIALAVAVTLAICLWRIKVK